MDAAERTAFLDTVLGLLDDGIVVRCVVAVRGDHVGRLAEHAAFTERLGSAVVLVPPLTEAELREVVREPAGAVGLTVEDELVDAVVADVLGRPGALPLLSTALVGTWERRRGDRLTLAGYLEAGGVTGVAEPVGRGGLGRRSTRRAGSPRGGCSSGWPTPTRAGRSSGGPLPLAELDLDGDRGAVRRTVIDGFVARRLLSARRRAARRRPRGAADRVAAPDPVAGGRRGRPRRPPAPDARPPRSGSAAAGRTTSCTAAPGSARPSTGPPPRTTS